MSVKRNEADQSLARYVGAYEWWKDTTKGRNVVLSVEIEPSGQKGVFTFTVAAVYFKAPKDAHVAAKVRADFPNASQGDFSSFLLGQVMKINQQVEDWLLDYHGETRTPR